MEIEIHDNSNIKWKIIEKFRDLHIREAKRETRSIDTWQKQFEAISLGLAFCVTARLDEELVSAAYFLCPDKICYYGSSASRRDLFDKPIFHALLWKAIKYAKEKRVKIFETGLEYSKEQEQFLTKKEVSIAKFKSGFGGNLKANLQINLNIGESST